MNIKIELITPERAEELLNGNIQNRKIKNYQVKKLATDMKNGNFKDSDSMICIDKEGHLLNGQHRLSAVIESGVSIQIPVAYDFDNAGMIDRPVLRSTSDEMKMHGIADPQVCTKEAVGRANCYHKILYGDSNNWTDSEKEDFLCANSENIILAISISRKSSHNALLKKSSTQSAIFGALNANVSVEKLYRFAECVNTGFINGDKESAAIVLRNYLLQPNPLGGGSIQKHQAASTEQAIRDFVNGTGRRKAYPVNKHVYLIPKNKGGDDLSAV